MVRRWRREDSHLLVFMLAPAFPACCDQLVPWPTLIIQRTPGIPVPAHKIGRHLQLGQPPRCSIPWVWLWIRQGALMSRTPIGDDSMRGTHGADLVGQRAGSAPPRRTAGRSVILRRKPQQLPRIRLRHLRDVGV
jgi:hypothetical protein